MIDTRNLLAQAYRAFNGRDIDGALALMSDDVSWPRSSEGGRALGKQEVRDYWTHQWQQFDPHVEPLQIVDRPDGTAEVRVHQLVKSLGGEVLADSEVWHVFTLQDGLIERMEVREGENSDLRLDSDGRWMFKQAGE